MGQIEDGSSGDSSSDTSKRLLHRGVGEGQCVCDFGKGVMLGAAGPRKEPAGSPSPRACPGAHMSLSPSVLLLLGFLLIFRNDNL